MTNSEKYSKLIEIWQCLEDSRKELKELGYKSNRGALESLCDSLSYLGDDIDELYLEVVEEDE